MEVLQNVTHHMLCENCPEGGDSGYFDICKTCARLMHDGVLLAKTLRFTDEMHEGAHNRFQMHRELDGRTACEHHLRAQELLRPGTTELAGLLNLKCLQLAGKHADDRRIQLCSLSHQQRCGCTQGMPLLLRYAAAHSHLVLH